MWSAPLLRRGSGTALLSLLCSATSIYHNQTFTFTRNSLNNKYIQCFNWDYKTFFIHTSGMKSSICWFLFAEFGDTSVPDVLIEIILPSQFLNLNCVVVGASSDGIGIYPPSQYKWRYRITEDPTTHNFYFTEQIISSSSFSTPNTQPNTNKTKKLWTKLNEIKNLSNRSFIKF